jgi:hypothetical protein
VDQSHCRSAPSATEQGHVGFVIRYTVHKAHSMTMLPILYHTSEADIAAVQKESFQAQRHPNRKSRKIETGMHGRFAPLLSEASTIISLTSSPPPVQPYYWQPNSCGCRIQPASSVHTTSPVYRPRRRSDKRSSTTRRKSLIHLPPPLLQPYPLPK